MVERDVNPIPVNVLCSLFVISLFLMGWLGTLVAGVKSMILVMSVIFFTMIGTFSATALVFWIDDRQGKKDKDGIQGEMP